MEEECSAEDIGQFEREIWTAHIHAVNQQLSSEVLYIVCVYSAVELTKNLKYSGMVWIFDTCTCTVYVMIR